MKTSFPAVFFALSLILASGGPVLAEQGTNEVSVVPAIDLVTIYDGLAQVERKASVRVQKGRQTLVVSHLPLSINPDTLIVRVPGTKVLDVKAEKVFLLESRREEVRKLVEELDRLLAEDAGFADRMTVDRTSLEVLSSLDKLGSEKVESDARFAKVSVEDWQKVLDYSERSRLSRLADLRDLEARRLALAEKISLVQKKIDQLAGSGYLQIRDSFKLTVRDRISSPGADRGRLPQVEEFSAYFKRPQGDAEYRILCEVEAVEEKTCRFELVTTQPSASWSPLYDVRAYPGQGKVEVTYEAMVRQQTGEDWNDASLVLSTARPSAAMSPSPLSPWYLDIYTPQVQSYRKRASARPQSGGAPSAMMKEESVLSSEPLSPDEYAPAPPPPPVSESRSVSVVFPIRSRTTVPSSAEGQKVTIESFSVSSKPLKFEYYAVPETGDRVFLSVVLTNRQSYPLMSGRANVFIDNDLAGAAMLPDLRENQDYRLFLGRDESVTAKKELVKKFTDTKAGSVEVNYFYRITLKNLKDKPVNLVLKDSLPVSRSDDIKVSVDSIEPGPIDTDVEKASTDWQVGFRRWMFELAAGQEKVVEEKYSVRYQADKPAYPMK